MHFDMIRLFPPTPVVFRGVILLFLERMACDGALTVLISIHTPLIAHHSLLLVQFIDQTFQGLQYQWKISVTGHIIQWCTNYTNKTQTKKFPEVKQLNKLFNVFMYSCEVKRKTQFLSTTDSIRTQQTQALIMMQWHFTLKTAGERDLRADAYNSPVVINCIPSGGIPVGCCL